ncbi:unnamed protein product [Phaedon cochleariae]|uniref:Double jelly roll-like domain-containing protein n=1 Tax=Phaedon cochleariae TaxID=80249 RepID=A0A9N9SCA5_PHACE|nr:unnamed protein product [Phaedon cochleariae]
MSLIVTLKGRTSTLSIDFLTPLQLDPDSDYGLALLGFHSYNSIPNIDKGSKFYLQDKTKAGKIIDIPEVSYDIATILSAPVFDVFRKPRFDESITKVEWRTYYPYVKSFENNDVIDITVDQADSLFEGIITIKGKLVVTGGGIGTSTHNAGAYLFDSCTYESCNKELDTVRYSGITSNVREYLCYTPEDSRHLAIAGWNYPNASILNADKTFSMNIPLKHLFSIINDHQVATWGKQSIRFVRARNDANSVKVVERANTALPGSRQTQSTAKITIESINLKVSHLTPNDDIKLQLLTRIKADESMMIPFRRWLLHELPALTQGSAIEICLRYVEVFFQTKKADNSHEDVTSFDNANIKSIRLALNSDYYPQERMLLDFSKDQYADAHFNYTDFNKSYHNCQQKRSLVNFNEFKTRPMFVIDCSRRHLGLKSSTVDTKLDIEATTGFFPDTKAYCIIVHDQIIELLPLSGIVRNIA